MQQLARERKITWMVTILDYLDAQNPINPNESKGRFYESPTRGVRKKMACLTKGAEETPKTGYERPGCHICGQLSTGLVVKGLNRPSSSFAYSSVRRHVAIFVYQLSTILRQPPCKEWILYISITVELTDLFQWD